MAVKQVGWELQQVSKKTPWARMKGEGPEAFAAFVTYRDMGPKRSIVKLTGGRQNRGKRTQAEKWSTKFNWVARCVDWEQHLDTVRTSAAEQEVADQRRRQIDAAQKMQGLGLTELAKLIDKATKDEKATISVRELRWFLKDGTSMERVALGEPTEVTQVTTDDGVEAALEKMTPRQIKIQKALNKIARGEELSETEQELLGG